MKSTTGFVFGLIGGILSLLGGLIIWILSFLVFIAKLSLSEIEGYAGLSSLAGRMGFVLLLIGTLAVIIGILSIVFSVKMRRAENWEVKKGGIWCLILGILGLNLITLVGGILGVIASSNRQDAVII